MARSFIPLDGKVIMNALVKQATGQQAITVVDASTFASAGELVLSTGIENTLNSLNIVMGRTLMAVRPYEAKLKIINALNTGIFTSRIRKISFYSQDVTNSGDWNTDVYTNLADGYTAGQNPNSEGVAQSTKSQWEQVQSVVLELNFGGQTVWDFPITVYENQLAVAFRSEQEFTDFVSAMFVERANDIESQKEAYNRLALLQKIGSVYDMADKMPGSVINLTAAFNAKFGTSYTSAQLRTTYLSDFLAFFVATFKLVSKQMTLRSTNFHWSPTKTVNGENRVLLRHTPYKQQRALLYSPLFTEAESLVLPQIFNPQYLDINTQYEDVLYWQSIENPETVKVIPAITGDDGIQVAGATADIPYVVGLLYDVDGLMTDFMFEGVNTTPVEARKRYYNIWHHNSKNVICDNTENSVLFIMAD